MLTDEMKNYLSKIDTYTKKELEEEYIKLNRLISSIYQEYRDREETIYLISRQRDEVKNRMVSADETQAI